MRIAVIILALFTFGYAEAQNVKTTPSYDNVKKEQEYKERKSMTYIPKTDTAKEKPAKLFGNKTSLSNRKVK